MKLIILPEDVFYQLNDYKHRLCQKYDLDVNVEGYGFFLENSSYAKNLILWGKSVIYHEPCH